MDFGACLDIGHNINNNNNNNNNTTTGATVHNPLFSATSDCVADVETKQKWYGSVGSLKQEERHRNATAEDDIRDSKIAKTTTATVLTSPFLGSQSHQTLSFSAPYYQPASFNGNSGLSCGNIHGVITGTKGPFTPSQWMELEHQALIYKYITANVPIPPYLLNPIRKALESAAISTFGLRASSLRWGSFHVGFSNNTDPEPGRCRRTDGKKWRCSRDAVAEQKYCERHMNRGRHRSRKPVEGPSGQSPAATSAAVVSGGGGAAASNNLGGFSNHNHQVNNLQPQTNPSPASHLDRSFMDKEYVGEIVKDRHHPITKEQNPYEESSTLKFGLVFSDSLLNPLSKGSSNLRNYGASDDVSDPEKRSRQQHPLHQFMDVWSKNLQSDHQSTVSDSTRLCTATSDFMSSTSSSPTNEKTLSREMEATRMRLGVGTVVINDQNQRHENWIPTSWEPSSIGGPLGEVFHGPGSASSQTDVLQRSVFYSMSNSSAGSSPRTENSKNNIGASSCNVILGSSLVNPSLPAL